MIKKQKDSVNWSRTQASYVLFKWASTAKRDDPQPGERPPPEFDGHADFSPPKWFIEERTRLSKGRRNKGREPAGDETAAEDIAPTMARGGKKKRPRNTAPASEDESSLPAPTRSLSYAARGAQQKLQDSDDDQDQPAEPPVKRARSRSQAPRVRAQGGVSAKVP